MVTMFLCWSEWMTREKILRQELGNQIESAVMVLPETQRALILMCDFEEKSYEEIAGIMDCTVSYVKTNIHRARLKLRERLRHLLVGGEV